MDGYNLVLSVIIKKDFGTNNLINNIYFWNLYNQQLKLKRNGNQIYTRFNTILYDDCRIFNSLSLKSYAKI